MKHKKHTEKHSGENPEGLKTDNIAGQTDAANGTHAENARDAKVYTEAEFQTKVNELNDKYLRLHAEFDNYRKRSLKEKLEMSQTASEDVIKDLLPVLDDFDRAQNAIQKGANVEAVSEGVQLIQSKLKKALENRGLKEMNTIGEDFDTDFQEAITCIPAPTPEQKNKVIDEVQKGYLLHDKVIRFAKVVIGN